MIRITSPGLFPAAKCLIFALCLALILPGCATVVQIQPPFGPKVRPGDGVKVTMKDGTLISGRVTYVDNAVIVVRTPRQTMMVSPVKMGRFGTTIQWVKVRQVKVAGTLDSQGRLISNEEIRVNHRSKNQRIFTINIGLLGTAASFLAGVRVQDSISPASTDLPTHRHNAGRVGFWMIWIGGSLASLASGYLLGDYLDRRKAIERIEINRLTIFKARLDAIRLKMRTPPDTTAISR